jgi:hypothetical protein
VRGWGLATVTAADEKQLICRRLAQQFAISDFLTHRKDDANTFLQRICETTIAAAKHVAVCNS